MSNEIPTATDWQHAPRPLHFVRIRLWRGGQAEYIRDLLSDEKESLFEELTELRTKGKQESDPAIIECRANLMHVINALKDVDRGLIELVGPEPRY